MKALYLKMTSILNNFSWLPLLIARLTVGYVFVESGWGKLNNLEKVTEFFTQLGIPYASAQAPFVAGVEFVGGILLIIGLLSRITTIPLIATMIVALITAKASDIASWSDVLGLSEFLYIVAMLTIMFLGPGRLSSDRAVGLEN